MKFDAISLLTNLLEQSQVEIEVLKKKVDDQRKTIELQGFRLKEAEAAAELTRTRLYDYRMMSAQMSRIEKEWFGEKGEEK